MSGNDQTAAAAATANAPLPRAWGVVALLLVAVTFSANHIAARVAFDHGVNVLTAVMVRSFGTVLLVYVLLQITRTPIVIPRAYRGRIVLLALLIAGQSYCLYSAVARLPVALGLLAFNTFPFVLGIVSWLAGGERPSQRTWVAMVFALVGLALALDAPGKLAGQASEISLVGVAFALAASVFFALVIHVTTVGLPAMDARVRSMAGMAVVGLLTGVIGLATAGLAWPVDGPGWTGLTLLTLLYGTAFISAFVVFARVSAVNNAAIMNFEPVSALILAWLLLGQTITPIQVAGVLVVIGAIVAMSFGKR